MADFRARFEENAPGDFYVDRGCIDCARCRERAAAHFGTRPDGHAFVRAQPVTEAERKACAEALAACPVAAIGSDGLAPAPAPLRRLMPAIWSCGHPSPLTDGAASYLLIHPEGNVLVDVPDPEPALLRRLEGLGDLRYIFLTHADTLGDVERFAWHFGAEILMHEAEAHHLAGLVERPLTGALALYDDVTLLHTPGHSPGSCCLLWRHHGGSLFCGDHLLPGESGLGPVRFGWTADWAEQQAQARRLLAFEWRRAFPARRAETLPRGYVAPGHPALARALSLDG